MPELTLNSSQSTPPSDGLELACTGILRTEFGRRPSAALAKAMVQLTAAEALAADPKVADTTSWAERLRGWWPGLRPGLAFGLVLFLGAGLGAWYLLSGGLARFHPAVAVCTVSGEINGRRADGAPLKVGDVLPAGPLRLAAGVVELTFASTAKVAVEGPAQLELTGPNSLDLQQGKLAAEVPRHARDFAVNLPAAKLVDLGTRFGVNVNDRHASVVEVFEGRVELTTGNDAAKPEKRWRLTQNMAMAVDQGQATPAAFLPETAYAQPSRMVYIRPQNCGFDAAGLTRLAGIPTGFGYWSGPAYSLTGAVGDVNPASGAGMLSFSTPAGVAGGDSEVWQLIDLRPYKNLLAGGDVQLKSCAEFNRAGGPSAGGKFGLTVAAFGGSPAEAAALWARRDKAALAFADQELVTDENPATWEKIEVTAPLPASADFLMVAIRAINPGETGEAPSAGHFADLVDVYLCLPLRAGSVDFHP